MSQLTEKQKKAAKKNRLAFGKMNLEQRLAMRRTLAEAEAMNIPLLRMSRAEKRALRHDIAAIDDINLKVQLASRKRLGMNQK